MALSYCTDGEAAVSLMSDKGLLHHDQLQLQVLEQQQVSNLINLPFNFDDVDINAFLSMDAGDPTVLPPTDDHHYASFSDPSVLSLPRDPNHSPEASSHQHLSCTEPSRSIDGLCQCSSHPFTNIYHSHRNVLGFNSALPGYLGHPPLGTEGYQMGRTDKKATSGGISAQSIAARERRKKISDRTRVLARLVPGGTRMNTAEMFQAAANYVMFLQAQVGILNLMPPRASQERVYLHKLLSSPSVQERLYRAEKCIVPKRMVEDLGKDRIVRSHPSISKDVDRLLLEFKDQEPKKEPS